MQRIAGVDVARGLAVLGMVTAHVGPGGPQDPWPWSLAQVADGRPAALFVLLSGVSVALLSGGHAAVTGTRRVQARTRLLVRAFLVLAVGVLVELLGTPVAVILPTYAVLFACAVPLLGTPPRRLLVAAAVVAALSPVLRIALDPALERLPGRAWTEIVTGTYYPAVVWFAYVLVGLAVGRTDLRSTRVRLRLLGTGVALAVVGHGASALLTRAVPPDGTLAALVTTEPHSSSPLEVVANTGVALAVLALSLVVADAAPRLVAPVAATGALALTAYTGHLVAIAVLGDDVVWEPDAATWLAFLVGVTGMCWLWRAAFGRGPLERLLHDLAARASDVAPDAPPPARA
ncbi:heparan-alpha-glucosaminide N-acetyltransferase domain-containing protein [Cellulomonas sp. P4]|uniref:heparan-alpha-glucosaminide N-acetyltransferase domain-containing protein n=1 Tax=Cellulomonas sp. P4 TaxID=3142533 RepID=UPI0031BAB66A